MTDRFTRVTLATQERNVELLLPSTTPVGGLMPSVLNLVGRGPDDQLRRVGLSRVGGPDLDERSSLEESEVMDGTVLLLTAREDSVPSPVVYDIADYAASMRDGEPGGWGRGGRVWVGGLVFTIFGTAAYWFLTRGLDGRGLSITGVAVAALLLMTAAAVPREKVRLNLFLPVLALAVVGVAAWDRPARDLFELWMLITAGVLAVLAFHFSGRDYRAAATSAVVAVVVAGLWVVTLLLTHDVARAAAVSGTLTVALLGYLPRLALGWAGLNALDDDRANGQTVHTGRVQYRLEQAHHGMASATLWCAVSVGTAAWVLTRGSGLDPWGLPLVVVWLVVLALRARAFPLSTQKAWLILGSSIGAVLVVAHVWRFDQSHAWWLGLLLVVMALLAALPLVAHAPDYFWARTRILADRAEAVATLAMFPLVLGYFGLYSILLETFQS